MSDEFDNDQTPQFEVEHRVYDRKGNLLRVVRDTDPDYESFNAKGEATYAVPTDRFPPQPLPKP